MAGSLGNAASVRTDAADDERDLVVRVQRGDKHAFDQLARRYARRAFAVAYRVLRQTEDAEDLVQDAFVAALDGIGSFDPSRPFAPWFFKIVVNRALNAASARSTRERYVGVIHLWTGDAVAIDADPAERAEIRTRFESALSADLALTDAQVVRLAAISRRTDARHKAMEARFDSARTANQPAPGDTTRPRRPVGPPPEDLQRTRDQARADIRDAIAVLTPDQQATAWMMIADGGGLPLGAAFAGPMTPGRERGFGEGRPSGAGRRPIDRPPPPRDVPRRPEGSERTEP